MSTTANTPITQGDASGGRVALYTGTENAVTVALQRVVINKSDLSEIDWTTGTAGTPAGGVASVQGVTNMTPLAVTPATVGFSAAVAFNRTADTNIYAANDVLGAATGSTAALSFTSMGASGGRIMITSIALEIDLTAIPSGMTSFRLYLYNVTPPSALGDNAAWDLPSGDRASFLGYVDLGTPADLGSTLYVEANGVNKQLLLSGTGLFGYLVTNGGYTPASATPYKVTLNAVGL